MALPPQKFREAVLQILFSRGFGTDQDAMIPLMMQELKTTRKSMLEALERVKAIENEGDKIDEIISSASTEYRFERISGVEKAILRLSIFELLFDSAIPEKVAIAEAIRLCRKFATPQSSQFINAILDGVYQKNAAPVPEEPQLI